MGLGDGVDPVIITSRDGSVIVRGGAAVDLSSAASGPLVTAFQFVPVPTATTTGPGAVTLMTVPVVVAAVGAILLAFAASIEVEILGNVTAPHGSVFTFLWDGAPIPPILPSLISQNAFMESDITVAPAAVGTAIESFSNQIHLRDVVPASLATVGPHVLQVQFEGLDAQSKVDVFDGSGALTIQTAPR